VRWEDTFAPYLEGEGFVRGDNEKSIFYHDEHDVLDLTFVDDNYLDGEEGDIEWASGILEDRFDCKELEWIHFDNIPLDYLGMEMAMTNERCTISMEVYITNCLEILCWSELRSVKTPIVMDIDASSEPLVDSEKAKFHTGLGFLGWLSMTNRPDITYAYSRIGQHQASPTTSAMDAVKRAFQYLSGTRRLMLCGPNHSGDASLKTVGVLSSEKANQHHWEFYCDSDFAGNSEVGNKRRSQNGYVALLNGVPVYWVSKVSSVCFACADIGEAHADMSSAGAEIYTAGNATIDFLHLGYVAEEMNVPFPKPFILQMDNDAAACFARDSVFKSKLKHIDCRQEWVKMLRDRRIMTPVHVDSADNLADIFTKILPVAVFESLRDRLMFDPDA